MALIPQVVNAEEASKLTLIKEAAETISALKLVKLNASDMFEIADKELYEDALVVGIAITAGAAGATIKAVATGIVEDLAFNFPLNDLLFLGNNGTITNIAPTTGHNVPVGYSLGTGAIFLNIEKPEIL